MVAVFLQTVDLLNKHRPKTLLSSARRQVVVRMRTRTEDSILYVVTKVVAVTGFD